MPTFDYEVKGTFKIMAGSEGEANLKARGFVQSCLRIFMDTYEYRLITKVKNDENNNTKRTERSDESKH